MMIEPTFCNFFFKLLLCQKFRNETHVIIWTHFTAWVHQKLGHLFSFVSSLFSSLHDIWHFGKLTIEDSPLLKFTFHWETGVMPESQLNLGQQRYLSLQD